MELQSFNYILLTRRVEASCIRVILITQSVILPDFKSAGLPVDGAISQVHMEVYH